MSLSRIRNRIEALERKFAVPLAVVRLRPLAEKVCDEWAAAKAADAPLPKRVCDKSPFPLGEGWGEGVPLLTQELQMPLKTATYSEKWMCHTPSKTQALIKRIADSGVQATTFGSLDRYFRECRDEGRFPKPRDIATVLFPHAAKKGVIYSIFGWDSAAPSGTFTTAGSA